MKKILLIVGSLLPIVLMMIAYFNNKDSVIKWNVICIEYIIVILIVYIRTIVIIHRYKKIIKLYESKNYEEIVNQYEKKLR